MKKLLQLVLLSTLVFTFTACSATDKESNDKENVGALPEGGSQAEGTQLAGEETPPVTGKFIGVHSENAIKVSVAGETVIFSLSEDAKAQLSSLKAGDEITFSTFSIGSSQLMISSFEK
jgi:Cu/Ag efflux protein CusF